MSASAPVPVAVSALVQFSASMPVPVSALALVPE